MRSQIRSGRKVGAVACTALLSTLVGCAAMDDSDSLDGDALAIAGGLDPIVFVPGCAPPGIDYPTLASMFDPMIDFFRSKGYPDSYLNKWVPDAPPFCPSNFDQADAIGAYIGEVRAATGAPRVDVIAVSGGPVATRVYIKEGGNNVIRDFVSISGVNHGTEFGIVGGQLQEIFGYPNYEQMKELYPPYACAGQTFFGQSADVQAFINGCLTPTGRTVNVDETPNGGVEYLQIVNTLDDQIIPWQSACLNQRFQNDCSDTRVNRTVTLPPGPCPFAAFGGICPPHAMPVFDQGVWDMTYAFVAHPDDGDDGDDLSGSDDDDD